MAQIVTCPHCGKLERYKGAAHTHCSFCRAALSGAVSAANRSGERSGHRQRDAVLRMTVFGGLWGGGIAFGLAFLFFGLPLIFLSIAPAEFGVD